MKLKGQPKPTGVRESRQESARDLRSLVPLSPTPFVLDAHKNVEI